MRHPDWNHSRTLSGRSVTYVPSINRNLCVRAVHMNELAIPAGFEPATIGLEGRCSIQLSYGTTQAG
jgi:hypothetical protein